MSSKPGYETARLFTSILLIGLVAYHPTWAQTQLQPWRTVIGGEISAQKVAMEAWERIAPACPSSSDPSRRYFLQIEAPMFRDLRPNDPEILKWKRLWQFRHVTLTKLEFDKLSPATRENGVVQRAASQMRAVTYLTRQNFPPLAEPAAAQRRIGAGQWSDPWSPVYDNIALTLILEQNRATGWHVRLIVPTIGVDSNLASQEFGALGDVFKLLQGQTPDGSFADELDVDAVAQNQFSCDKSKSDDPFAYKTRTRKVTAGQFVCPGVHVMRISGHRFVPEILQSPQKIVTVTDPGETVIQDDNGKDILFVNHGFPTVTFTGYAALVLQSRNQAVDACPGVETRADASSAPATGAPTSDPLPEAVDRIPVGLAVLTIHSGFPGQPNPLSHTPFNLMRDDFTTTLRKAGIRVPEGIAPRQAFARVCSTGVASCYTTLLKASTANAAATAVSGPNGEVVLPPVPPGEYYVLIYGYDLNRQHVFWNEKVVLRPGGNSFTVGVGNAKPLQ